MKAVTRIFYGSPANITVKEVDNLLPDCNELLIKVFTTTVNRTDCAILQAKPAIMRLITGWITPNNKILGTDFAGVVEAVGHEVTTFEVGDRVWGFDDNGLSSQAEFITVAEDKSIRKLPDNLLLEDAAGCIEGAHYAYNFFNKVVLTPNHKVLINGATGAIGSALLQMVKSVGASVTATCRGEHSELIKSLGADRVIDYTRTDFTTENEFYDFVFDTVGKSTYFKCKNILTNRGTYISSELGPYVQNPILALTTPFFNNKKVKFPLPINILASLTFVSKLIEQGKFRPLIDRSYSIEQANEAYDYVLTGQKVGNVILKVNQEPV